MTGSISDLTLTRGSVWVCESCPCRVKESLWTAVRRWWGL